MEDPPGLFQESSADATSDEEEYEVEAILDRRKRRGNVQYLIRWKGYQSDSDTWQDVSELVHCRELIDHYEDQQQETIKRKRAK